MFAYISMQPAMPGRNVLAAEESTTRCLRQVVQGMSQAHKVCLVEHDSDSYQIALCQATRAQDVRESDLPPRTADRERLREQPVQWSI